MYVCVFIREHKTACWSFSDHPQNNDVSHCPVGMASSQSINSLTACLTKDQNLQMECRFTLPNQGNATCTYIVDKKVAASTNITNKVDPAFQNRGSVNMHSDKCVFTLTGFADSEPKMYNCTIQQDKSVLNMGLTVDKSKIYIYIYGLYCQLNAVSFCGKMIT